MNNFEALGVSKDLVKGLNELNINTPTTIQQEVIPLLNKSQIDLVGQAQTGTGKTAAFGLPLLQKIDTNKNEIQGLILCPTRELGQQIAKQLFRYTKYYSKKVFTEAVYGGEKIDRQIERLKRPTHIVVATPGRLLDLIRRKDIDIRAVKNVILDEADEMLSMGFRKELDAILKQLPTEKSTWLFSATLPAGIMEIVSQHMRQDAQHIKANRTGLVNSSIEHQYLVCDDEDKLSMLLGVLKTAGDQRGIIFCKTKAATEKLSKQLIAKNILSGVIHGDLLQKERDKAMRAFKNKSFQFLVATDIAARGIDVDNLSFVIHYQLPDKDEYYTHRSGRTARGGKEGISLAIVNFKEVKSLRHFENVLKIEFRQIREK